MLIGEILACARARTHMRICMGTIGSCARETVMCRGGGESARVGTTWVPRIFEVFGRESSSYSLRSQRAVIFNMNANGEVCASGLMVFWSGYSLVNVVFGSLARERISSKGAYLKTFLKVTFVYLYSGRSFARFYLDVLVCRRQI